MRELMKRIDPVWLRLWLTCYGGSLTVLAAYLASAVAAAARETFPSLRS